MLSESGANGPRPAWSAAVDAWLLGLPPAVRAIVVAATAVVMVLVSVPKVPRAGLDYSGLPWLAGIAQRDTYGTDTISDMYGAKVVLNDPLDMFVKAKLAQTPLEAATWSKEASAPYPPVVLLTEAALFAAGEHLGIGFYGVILGFAGLFLAGSAYYFWRTRWYLFPLLYLNFTYFSERFVYVQDSTYIIMLVVVLAALFLARHGRQASHLLIGLAITMKLSPLYYVKNVLTMPRRTATAFVAIVTAGLVLPYFIWDNYLYIYRYANELKGDWDNAAAALAFVVPFSLAVWYVETKLGFDREDRIGWGLVPFAMFLALKMNVARHLLIVLLVPDKRGVRNIAAAIALLVPAVLPVPFSDSLLVATGLLVVGLGFYLREIGWPVVREDFRHPGRTMRMMVNGADNSMGIQARRA